MKILTSSTVFYLPGIIALLMISCQIGEEDYLLSDSRSAEILYSDIASDVGGSEDTEIPRCSFGINQMAYERPGYTKDGILLVDGRLLTPAGRNITVNTFPMNIVEVADKGWLVVTNNGRNTGGGRYLQVIDIINGETIYKYRLDGDYGNFLGLYMSQDRRTLYVSGGTNGNVLVLRLNEDGTIEKKGTIPLSGFVGHLVLNREESRLFVVQHVADRIAIVSIGDDYKWETSIRVGLHSEDLPYAYPFWITLSKDEKRLYVSNWDDRTVSVVDISKSELVKNIEVGKNPEGVLLSDDGRSLYVANSDTDDISVIDTEKDELIYTIDLNGEELPYRLSPTVMDISEEGRYLFVPEANSNSVSVVDTDKRNVIGRIPVGFYPVRALLSADQKRLYVVNAKGNGGSPNIKGEDADEILFGSVSIIEIEDIFNNLEEYSARVDI